MSIVKRFSTYPDVGSKHVHVDDKINAYLEAHPNLYIRRVHPIMEDRSLGVEHGVLVVFEEFVKYGPTPPMPDPHRPLTDDDDA